MTKKNINDQNTAHKKPDPSLIFDKLRIKRVRSLISQVVAWELAFRYLDRNPQTTDKETSFTDLDIADILRAILYAYAMNKANLLEELADLANMVIADLMDECIQKRKFPAVDLTEYKLPGTKGNWIAPISPIVPQSGHSGPGSRAWLIEGLYNTMRHHLIVRKSVKDCISAVSSYPFVCPGFDMILAEYNIRYYFDDREEIEKKVTAVFDKRIPGRGDYENLNYLKLLTEILQAFGLTSTKARELAEVGIPERRNKRSSRMRSLRSKRRNHKVPTEDKK